METNVKNKVAFIISMTIIGVAALFLIIAGFLAFMPVQIIKANRQPYIVTTPALKAGDPITYIADVCKYKDVSSLVTRTFVDENNVHYPIPQQQSNIPSGCHQNKVIVPTLGNLHPGRWYMTLDVEYRVNILRSETYHFTTDTFVIEAE